MTDNGFSYVKNLSLRQLLARSEIKHLTTKPYRLRTNGKVELCAVGREPSPQGRRTFAVRWNGRNWRIVPSPDLPNVKGIRPDDEGEVLSDGALAPDGTLYTVASPTGANARLDGWDGPKWTQILWPVQDYRADIAVRSHPDIWAAEVDDADRSFLHHWDGARWVSLRPPGGITTNQWHRGRTRHRRLALGERRSGSGVALRLHCA